MKYTPAILREVLRSLIRKLGETPEQFVRRPGRDFTRPRTLRVETVISLLLTMSENSAGKVLMEHFKNREDTPSASYPGDPASYRPGTERQHGWNLWHLNALYDLQNGIYTDVIVQKEHEKDEKAALCAMVDRSAVSGPVILLADRGV